ncbi:hypothetical protein Hdeb2414_s0009g00321261 [Helianthus debilis subsp. tardiflorus]
MQVQDQTQCSFEVTSDSILDSIYESVSDGTSNRPPSSSISPQIPRLPLTVMEKPDYEKYYVPMFVSIGPYHFGEPKLQFVEDYSELNSNEIGLVRRDLFLLENQIPFKVLKEVLRFRSIDLLKFIKRFNGFINLSSFVIRKRPKRKWLDNLIEIFSTSEGVGDEDDEEPSHLLGALHGKHSRIVKASRRTSGPFRFKGHNFRNVTELVDVGISFKPIKDTLSMAHIEYVKGWWGFSATVKLPPIAVSKLTRPMLLNMIAYECYCSIDDIPWVSCYVQLLATLIDHPEDVKVLRKAWVLDNYLASDQEVVKLFDEIGSDLARGSSLYLEAMYNIQRHYESRRNTLLSQLKNEYFKSPWAIFALIGALIVLFLTGVQTYFTVWNPKSTCDDLCMFLKMNHHL